MLWEYIYRTIFIYFGFNCNRQWERGKSANFPFDFVVAIIIAELAVIPLESDLPIWHSILPLVLLGALEVIISYATLFSHTLRGLICGIPRLLLKTEFF